MKVPSIPLQIVFKVVQVDKYGRMFSANPSPSTVRARGQHVLRYRLRHQVLPSTATPALFACPTLEDAKMAWHFYHEGRWGYLKKVYILRGYAANVRQVNRSTVRQDEAFVEYLQNHDNTLRSMPLIFNTVLCDWFIPIGIVPHQ